MHNSLKQLRKLRRELESFCPPMGLKKWSQILQSMRVAGEPRAVSAAKHVVLLTDFAEDPSVGKELQVAAKAKIEWWLDTAAYKEIARFDQVQLKKYFAEFRENDYLEPSDYLWEVNSEIAIDYTLNKKNIFGV